jgi:hypothetical protein
MAAMTMAQHFLFSAAARSPSAAKIMHMSDRGVDNVFLRLRWPETDANRCVQAAAYPKPDRCRPPGQSSGLHRGEAGGVIGVQTGADPLAMGFTFALVVHPA